jgi:hypothetical protein
MARVPKVTDAETRGIAAAGSRITIRETLDGLGIYNPSRLNVPMVLFLLLWLGGWSVGEYFAISEILSSGNLFTNAFLLVWVTFWTIGGAFCWWMVLWNLFGSERLFVTGGAVVRSVGLGPLRWRRVFPVASISNLRMVGPGSHDATTSAIAFEAGGRTRRFGVSMDRAEMEASMAALKRVLPESATLPGDSPAVSAD